MKDFLKYVLATVAGIVVLLLVVGITSVVSLIGMASSSAQVKVSKNSVLVINLSGQLTERAEDDPFFTIFGDNDLSPIGLDNLLKAIGKAETEKNIKGIYMEAGALGGASPAMLQEIRQKLVAFKKSGKPIVAYGDVYTQGAYYLCSVADSVVINPQGMLDWKGLATQSLYFKDLLDKVGVKMEIFKVGTYKSAVEPFFLNEMSEANKEQIRTFSDEIWKQMLADVSKSRGMTVQQLNALADTAQLFQEAKTYRRHKLVDKLAYSDEVPLIITNTMGFDSKDDYRTITVNDLAAVGDNEPKGLSGKVVAVYYAAGEIVETPSKSFGSKTEIVGTKVCKDLQRLAEDDDVKAVVLRVNSPGGSAYASEQIWHQVMNIKSEKPVIVSMGGYAASGGYYISCAADWIVAEPTTLTGSIGIFGTFPVAQDLLDKTLGVHFQTVKTNKFADFGDISREMNEGERMAMQGYVDRGYELFTKRCADGRRMKQDDIKKIAEGRVWTGLHAKQIGLVDQLGNLDDAIAVAKKRAGVDDCTVLCYPAKSNFFDSLLEKFSGNSYADAKMKEAMGDYYPVFQNIRRIDRKGNVQAQLPYYLLFNL